MKSIDADEFHNTESLENRWNLPQRKGRIVTLRVDTIRHQGDRIPSMKDIGNFDPNGENNHW